MSSFLLLVLVGALHVCARLVSRDNSGEFYIPTTPKPPGTFSNGAPLLQGEPPQDTITPIPAVYGTSSIDLPFFRLYHGNMIFFPPSQLNTPKGITDTWGSQYDNANQSACGIPDNAFYESKVAIHPYFLKYASLNRFCMTDVCISFWREDGLSDMMLKVTDICSTDPTDPSHCPTPADIKVDRHKVATMEKISGSSPLISGTQYPNMTWWFFMKCWDDGLAQPAYQSNASNASTTYQGSNASVTYQSNVSATYQANTSNWFTTPRLPNNIKWAQGAALQQYNRNQAAYPARGWPTYPQGGYKQPYQYNESSPPITDWIPGQEPSWEPLAGGVGWGVHIPYNSTGEIVPIATAAVS